MQTYTCVKKNSGEIVGVFSVGKRRVFYQQEIKNVRYFSDLRIDPKERGSRLLYQIGRYIIDHGILGDDVAQTIVFADNEVMLKLIDKLAQPEKRMSLFKFFPAGEYISYMVKFSSGRQSEGDYMVRKAGTKDITQMQSLVLSEGSKKEFFPYYDFNFSGNDYYRGLAFDNYYLAFKGEELVGMAGVWDQHSIKQTRIYDYSTSYKMLRPALNIYGRLTNGFILPSKGTVLRYLTIHSIIIKNNESAIFDSILNKINNDFRTGAFDYFLVGLDERDSLNDSMRKFSNKKIVKGRHFIVANKDEIEESLQHSLYYLEAARI
ncbi:hypothetical protein [Segetibacter aerophilus]|nr:hypothetical protein [Segetibacter aerophilus]